MTDAEKKPAKIKETHDKKPEKKTVHKKAANSTTAGFSILIFFIAIAIFGTLYLLWENQQKTAIKGQITTQPMVLIMIFSLVHWQQLIRPLQ